jgi:hypothetical protein
VLARVIADSPALQRRGREILDGYTTSLKLIVAGVRNPQLALQVRAQVGLAITLDREEVPIGILEPGDVAAASAG